MFMKGYNGVFMDGIMFLLQKLQGKEAKLYCSHLCRIKQNSKMPFYKKLDGIRRRLVLEMRY